MESGQSSAANKPSEPHLESTINDDELFGFTSTSFTDAGLPSSNNKSKTPAEFPVDLRGLDKKDEPDSPSSTSSSAFSDSFDENFFLMDENDPRRSNVGGSTRHLKVDDSQTTRAPDVPGLSSESGSPSKSPKQSPPIQVMERLEPPDPNRIPSTVFARNKSTTPEWSTQSNESLFSIHMGNNSFSKDQIFLMGRSQELGKSDDMFKFPNNTVDDGNKFNHPAETMKEVIRENAEDRNKAKPAAEAAPRSSSMSHRSDGSAVSTISFAFPILTQDGAKSNSAKVEPEKKEPEKEPEQPPAQSQPAAANTTGTNWFSCFSCSFCRGANNNNS